MDRNLDISSETFEQAERYLLQQMPDAEKQAFETALATDVKLQDAVQQVQLVMLGIQEAALTESMDHFHQTLPAATNALLKISRLASLKRWMVAASIGIIVATGGWWLYHSAQRNENLYAAYFKPDPGLITAMSSTDNYAFDKAMVDYKTGRYVQAITAWKGLQQNNPTSDTLNYFIGVALLANHQTADAIPYLKKVTEVKQSYFLGDAYWYTGLALLKENRIKEAVPFIRLSNYQQKEALLKQLEEMHP